MFKTRLGMGATEYAVVFGLIALVAFAMIQFAGRSSSDAYNRTQAQIDAVLNGGGALGVGERNSPFLTPDGTRVRVPVNLQGPWIATFFTDISSSTLSTTQTTFNFQRTFQILNAGNDVAAGIPAFNVTGADSGLVTIDASAGSCANLAPGATCTANINLRAIRNGRYYAMVKPANHNGADTPLTWVVTGMPNGNLNWEGDPSFVIPASQPSSTPITRTYTLRNLSNSPSPDLNNQISLVGPARFVLVSTTCTGVIGANGTCQAVVRYTPSPTATDEQATLIAPDATLNLAASVGGLDPRIVIMVPDSSALNAQTINIAGPTANFTLRNIGARATDSLSGNIFLAGSDPSKFEVTSSSCWQGLPADGTCVIGIRMKPANAGTVFQAKLEVDVHNKPSADFQAQALGALLSIDNLTDRVGSAPINFDYLNSFGFTRAASTTHTVTNVGTGASENLSGKIQAIGLGADTLNPGFVTTSGCEVVLQKDQSCTLTVTVAGNLDFANMLSSKQNNGFGVKINSANNPVIAFNDQGGIFGGYSNLANTQQSYFIPRLVSGGNSNDSYGSVQALGGASTILYSSPIALGTNAPSPITVSQNGGLTWSGSCTTITPQLGVPCELRFAPPSTSGTQSYNILFNHTGLSTTLNQQSFGTVPNVLTLTTRTARLDVQGTTSSNNFNENTTAGVSTAGSLQSFSILNVGPDPVQNVNVECSGANCNVLDITSNNCSNVTLNANATCSFSASRRAGVDVSSTPYAFNIFASGSAGNSGAADFTVSRPFTMNITGPKLVITGIPTSGASGSPDANWAVNGTGATSGTWRNGIARSYAVTNTGTATANLTVLTSSTGASSFDITTGTNACGSTLSAGATCNVWVRFRANANNSYNGTLLIQGGTGSNIFNFVNFGSATGFN